MATTARSRLTVVVVVLAAAFAAATGTAYAAFPYGVTSPGKKDYHLPDSQPRPNDLQGKLDWMYSATPGTENAVVDAPYVAGAARGATRSDRSTALRVARRLYSFHVHDRGPAGDRGASR